MNYNTRTTRPDMSRKRPGSPIDDYYHDSNIDKRPNKRLHSDNPPGVDDTAHARLSGALAPPPADSVHPSSAEDSPSLPLTSLHSSITEDKHTFHSSDNPPKKSTLPASGGEKDVNHTNNFEHQASIYPTPQTSNLNINEAPFELPPLRPEAFPGDEQATQVTLPRFNEIYGNLDFSLPQGATPGRASIRETPSRTLHSASSLYSQESHRKINGDPPVAVSPTTLALASQDRHHDDTQQQNYQLPLPHQPFAPTPDRLQAQRAQRIQEEGYACNLEVHHDNPSHPARQDSRSFLDGQDLAQAGRTIFSRGNEPVNTEWPAYDNSALNPALSSSIHFRPPSRRPSFAAGYYSHYPFEASSSGSQVYGLGITGLDRPQYASREHGYAGNHPQSDTNQAPTPSNTRSSSFNLGTPDFDALYANQQHKMLLHQPHQTYPPMGEAPNVFRPAYFPPETYAAQSSQQQRQSITHNYGYNTGAGTTLARAPSFNSPYGQHRGMPSQPAATPSTTIPASFYDPYSASAPGNSAPMSAAQRMVESIDLPTLHQLLRHWASVVSNPKTPADQRATASMNCQVVEKRIRTVTMAMQEQAARAYGGAPPLPPSTGLPPSAVMPAQSPVRPINAPTRPGLPLARMRSQGSDDLGSPAQALPSPLVKRTPSSSRSRGNSPTSNKTATPGPQNYSPSTASKVKFEEEKDGPKISPRLTLNDMAAKAGASRLASKSPVSSRKPSASSSVTARKVPNPGFSGADGVKDDDSTSLPIPASIAVRSDTPASAGTEAVQAVASTEGSNSTANSPNVLPGEPATRKFKAASTGKKKSESPAPLAISDEGIYKRGDLIFENDWPKDDLHQAAITVIVGPPSLDSVTYSWSELECVRERRLMHMTAGFNAAEKIVQVKAEGLDSSAYTSGLDTSPYVQGAVVSCVFAEIFTKIPGEEVPIYWITYWDALKVCELSLDLGHRTIHYRRGKDLQSRIRSVLDKLPWINLRKEATPACSALGTKLLKYPVPKPVDNGRLSLKIMPWKELPAALEAVLARLRILI
ncbi:hypothetical protein P389DRAFT_178921 [Cystobasidium minutum MCA 4210]|uniref:uncharacterized protein n=1 Tax=Cystobasidium minutum MCA 4210 TaxID=1397322 RepID=UPI0034CE3141|eukprot:jgi/Rhomi1/178921/fgenesh1_pg.3_\